jgi:signal transduction histidine kinase
MIFSPTNWGQISPLFAEGGTDAEEEGEAYVPVRTHDRHLLVQVVPIGREQGGRILLLSDVTEVRKMESVVEAANLTDKLGYVFSGIRHEIGNPVNSIKVALNVLRKNLDHYDRPTIAEFVDRSLMEVTRIEYLLKALKNYSLFESPDIQRIRMDDFIGNFIPLVRDEFERRRVELRVMCADDTGWAMADPRALHHVLLNLLTNAANAVEDRPDGKVIISAMKSGPWVEIKVDDNGRGISEADQKNLFRPFFTSKQHGTGLGLVIVRKMVRKMDGRINVTSYENCGATVTVAPPEADGDERIGR